LQPSIPDGVVACAPRVPAAFGDLRVDNLFLADARLSIEATGDSVRVSGLPDSLHLVDSLSEALENR
jgi:hypothetical protein